VHVVTTGGEEEICVGDNCNEDVRLILALNTSLG
jgi:hypothetical protein